MNRNENNNGGSERRARTRISTTQLRLATKPNMTKSFKTFDGMTEWLNSEQTARLYRVGRIDWVGLTVRVEWAAAA